MEEISKTPTLESVIRILPVWAEVMVFHPKKDRCIPVLTGNVEELAEKFKNGKLPGSICRVEYLKPIDTSYEETKNLLFEIWVE